jgi:hypothetical protein
LDENVETAIAEQLRQRGIDVITVRDLGLLGDLDVNHLKRATEMERALCTYDRDYLRLAAEGVVHRGIIIGQSWHGIGDWVKGLELICGVYSAEDIKNHIEYLP